MEPSRQIKKLPFESLFCCHCCGQQLKVISIEKKRYEPGSAPVFVIFALFVARGIIFFNEVQSPLVGSHIVDLVHGQPRWKFTWTSSKSQGIVMSRCDKVLFGLNSITWLNGRLNFIDSGVNYPFKVKGSTTVVLGKADYQPAS